MRKTTFIMGLAAGTFTIIIAICFTISALGRGHDKNVFEVLLLFGYILAACLLVHFVYKAKYSEHISTGVWMIILSVICSFLPGALITACLFNYDPEFGDVLYMIMGFSFVLITIAAGILAIVSRKKPAVYSDGDTGSLVRNGKYGKYITVVVLAFAGGLINVVQGASIFLTLKNDFGSYYETLTLFPALFFLMLRLLAIIGAVVLMFNRMQGGILLTISGGLTLLLSLLFKLSTSGWQAVLIVAAAIMVFIAGMMSFIGFKKHQKNIAAAL